MRYDIGYIPFKDYWMNCYFNMVISILSSVDPSYRMAAFLNDYHYRVEEWQTELSRAKPGEERTSYTHLMLQPMAQFREDYLLKGIITYEPIECRTNERCLDFIRELIAHKNIVQVGVDLYYWLPDSFNWERNHWSHYSLISGFDDEKKAFYTFEEDRYGYGEHEIPEERFLTAIRNSTLNPEGNIMKVSEDIKPFPFSLGIVAANAKKLKDEISTMQMGPFWMLKESDFDAEIQRDLITVHIFQIINRQKGNEMLFQILQKDYSHSNAIDSFIQATRELQDGWSVIRAQMLKVYKIKENRIKTLEGINDNCKRMFYKEMDLWEQVEREFS